MVRYVDWLEPKDKYVVSDEGLIYRHYKDYDRPLKLYDRGKGYKGVRLNKKQYLVHRIVAKAFLGLDFDSNLQVNHINGIKSDNRLSNLELVTPSENIIHSYRNRLNKSVLSLDTATFISEVPYPNSKNFGYKAWCKKLGISEKNVNRIRKLDRNYSIISDNRLSRILLDNSPENRMYKIQVQEFYKRHKEFTQ